MQPERNQLEKTEVASQRDAERVDEIWDVVDVKMIEDIRVLKVHHDHQTRHVREPSEGSVRQARPDPDEAETELDGSADGSRTHYLA